MKAKWLLGQLSLLWWEIEPSVGVYLEIQVKLSRIWGTSEVLLTVCLGLRLREQAQAFQIRRIRIPSLQYRLLRPMKIYKKDLWRLRKSRLLNSMTEGWLWMNLRLLTIKLIRINLLSMLRRLMKKVLKSFGLELLNCLVVKESLNKD